MEMNQVIRHFDFSGELISVKAFGSGHINNTYLAEYRDNGKMIKYVIQQVNTLVFKDIDALMNNVFAVTDYLRERIIENGGDPERETLHYIRTKSGEKYVKTEDGACFRAYVFVSDSISYDTADTPELFKRSGAAFGRFQRLLGDFDADSLVETIPHFHDTPWRFHHEFDPAVQQDPLGKAQTCREEIRFVQEREARLYRITDAIANGSIPMRVTHNDTKLNNVLFDEKTGKSLAVIDLDTVMPGSALYDFGDSIRFGACTVSEEDTDLEKVQFSPEYFKAYAEGFLSEVGSVLTENERNLLSYASWLITVECGMRFLTDYLTGSHYFKTDYPQHNLDRAKNQFRLALDMERKMPQMEKIIKEI